MALRTLRRKVIIREYDFNKVAREATGVHHDGQSLYDRVSFIPLNQESLEKLKVLELLKGKEHTPLVKSDWNDNVPAMLLCQLRDYLYDKKYYDWHVTIDDAGFLCVQSRKNTPKTRLGWAVFEKDLKCRI